MCESVTHTFGASLNIDFFSAHSFELSLEWLYGGTLSGGDAMGDEPDIIEVGVPPVSLLSVVAEEGKPTPDNSTSSKPIMSSYMNSLSSKSGSWEDSI